MRESSEDKQNRLNCNVGFGIDNWNCYKDCAFWNGEKCTNHESKENERIIRTEILKELINLKDELTDKEISELGLILNCIKSRIGIKDF